jgi:hypothetical protein
MQSLSDKVSEGLPKPKALQELVHRGKVSLDELKKHRTPQDCWIQIKDKVYDVSGNQPNLLLIQCLLYCLRCLNQPPIVSWGVRIC